jgi:hypothetical protein
VKEALERFKVASTGRWAISVRTYVLTVPIAIAMNLESENLLNPGNASRSIAICMAGELASWLFLFISHTTLLKHRRERQQRISKCLFVWFGAGAVKSVVFIFYSTTAFGLEPDVNVRAFMPTLFTGATTGLLAFYFGTIDRRRIESSALTTVDRYLRAEKIELNALDRIARVEAVKSLRSDLEPEIIHLRSVASGLGNQLDNKKSKDELNEILELSRDLEDRIEREALKLSENRVERGRFDSSEAKAPINFGFVPTVISVRTSAVVITLGMFSGQIGRNGPIGVASGLFGTALLVIVLLALRKTSIRLSGTNFVIVIIASYPIVFLTQFIYVSELLPALFELPNPYLPWYSALKTIYGYYLASIVAGLLISNTEKLTASREVHDDLQSEIAALNQQQDLITQHILETRFGTIKGKIAGVTMALQLILNEDSSITATNLQSKMMTGALQLLTEAQTEVELLDIEFSHG